MGAPKDLNGPRLVVRFHHNLQMSILVSDYSTGDRGDVNRKHSESQDFFDKNTRLGPSGEGGRRMPLFIPFGEMCIFTAAYTVHGKCK